MAIVPAENGADEGGDQVLGQGLSHNPGTEAEDIRVVVLDHLVGRVRVMGDAGPYSTELVRRHAGARARAAHDDSPIRSAIQHRLGD